MASHYTNRIMQEFSVQNFPKALLLLLSRLVLGYLSTLLLLLLFIGTSSLHWHVLRTAHTTQATSWPVMTLCIGTDWSKKKLLQFLVLCSPFCPNPNTVSRHP